MFGVRGKGYDLKFYTNCKDFLRNNNNLIKNLIGQKLETIYWVSEVSTKEWFKDYPVVLKLSEGNCSLCSDMHTNFSMDWNKVDLKKELTWLGMKDFDLKWAEYSNRNIKKVIGKTIQSIEIVNFLPNFIGDYPIENKEEEKIIKGMGFLHGVGFNFGDITMVIVNGLENNNIVFFEEDYPKYFRRIIING